MILIVAAIIASLPLTSTAIVPVDGTRQVTYADLDLSTPDGARALNRRLSRAIEAMCADASGPSPSVTIDPDCKAAAWASVRDQLETTIAAAQRKDAELAANNPLPSEQ